MQWLDRFKDLLAIVIATIAVILSLVTVMAQRRQQRREAYRQIQDVLMSPELQRGRWMITEISRGKRGLPDRASPEFYLLNRTLGVFDTLAMYVRRGVVPREWVLDMWHHSLADMRAGARQLARRHQETNLDGHRGPSCGRSWMNLPGTGVRWSAARRHPSSCTTATSNRRLRRQSRQSQQSQQRTLKIVGDAGSIA